MAKATDTVLTSGFSSTVRKSLLVNTLGESITDANPLPIIAAASSSINYESASLQPGASADGYNVKTTGGMYSTVTTAVETTVKNRAGNSGVVTVYLKTDNTNPIVLSAGESIIIDKMQTTVLYLDTDSSFGALEYVDVILFG